MFRKISAIILIALAVCLAGCTSPTPTPPPTETSIPSPSPTASTLEEQIRDFGLGGPTTLTEPLDIGKGWLVAVEQPTMERPYFSVGVLVTAAQMQHLYDRYKDNAAVVASHPVPLSTNALKSVTSPEQYARVLVITQEMALAKRFFVVMAEPPTYRQAKVIQLDGSVVDGVSKFGDTVLMN